MEPLDKEQYLDEVQNLDGIEIWRANLARGESKQREKEQHRAVKELRRKTCEKTSPQWATEFIQPYLKDGKMLLRYWRGNFYIYQDCYYHLLSLTDIHSLVAYFIETHPVSFENPTTGGTEIVHIDPTITLVNNVISHLRTRSGVEISPQTEPDSWLVPPLWTDTYGKPLDLNNYIVISTPGTFILIDIKAKHCSLADSLSLRPSTPDYFTFYCLPFKYDPTATCPQWDNFLTDITGDHRDLKRVLRQWAGYLFTPALEKQKFLVLFGSGNNGKSTFVDVLRNLIGREHCSSCQISDFGETFKYYVTFGKRANIADENESRINDKSEALLKAYTSGESIIWEGKYQQTFTAPPTAKLIFTTNQCPSFGDTSIGLWRRLTIVPFYTTISEGKRDRHILQKLCSELPGIFNWALEGLNEIKDGFTDFFFPQICQKVLTEVRDKVNTVRGFLDANYVPREYAESIPYTKLYEEYVSWCTEPARGYAPVTTGIFARTIKTIYPMVKQVTIKGIKGYSGLLPKPETEEEISEDIQRQQEYDEWMEANLESQEVIELGPEREQN